jgi:mannose-1-phosphate guanylyltransferase
VLEYSKKEQGRETLTEKVHLVAGRSIDYQGNINPEVWTVTEGDGVLIMNGEFIEVGTGSTFTIPTGESYSWKAGSDMEFVVIQNGTHLMEYRRNKDKFVRHSEEPAYSNYS